jgi:hypothetical protein
MGQSLNFVQKIPYCMIAVVRSYSAVLRPVKLISLAVCQILLSCRLKIMGFKIATDFSQEYRHPDVHQRIDQ